MQNGNIRHEGGNPVVASINWGWPDWLGCIQPVFDMVRAIISGRISARDKG